MEPPVVTVTTLPVPVATPLRPGPVAVPDWVRAVSADLVTVAGQEAATSQRLRIPVRERLYSPAAQ